MAEEKTQEVETTAAVTGKTVGPFAGGFNNPTPMWATWIFRSEFILNKILTFWLTGTSLVAADKIKETLFIMATIDLGVWLFAKSLGIKKDDIDK